ncbi:hypothetical protein GCM10025867_49520 (plasmid) [Frondihabitans sucicola]|uniref:Uncharacterized protein n=1 Tax=Frondihabitans sucicola TaxID=1268041 RepID=A0ABN6Y9N9_9MICO|nr:hypothetical protein [Frondihabitans sucicola]BDZ52711.1 hypothetical protein GCM10025867_49520 [Frondihabitans sucicola]
MSIEPPISLTPSLTPGPIITSEEQLDALPIHSVVQLVDDPEFPTAEYFEKYSMGTNGSWLKLDPTDRDDGETLAASGYLVYAATRWQRDRLGYIRLVSLPGAEAPAPPVFDEWPASETRVGDVVILHLAHIASRAAAVVEIEMIGTHPQITLEGVERPYPTERWKIEMVTEGPAL